MGLILKRNFCFDVNGGWEQHEWSPSMKVIYFRGAIHIIIMCTFPQKVFSKGPIAVIIVPTALHTEVRDGLKGVLTSHCGQER